MAQFTNVATLNYGGVSVNSNVVTGEIRQSLSVTKDAVVSTYSYGDTVTYVINLINTALHNVWCIKTSSFMHSIFRV